MHRRFELEKTWDMTTGNVRRKRKKILELEFQA